jgi:hypothetical protein
MVRLLTKLLDKIFITLGIHGETETFVLSIMMLALGIYLFRSKKKNWKKMSANKK